MLGESSSYHARVADARQALRLSARSTRPNLSLQLALITTLAAAWLHQARISSLASSSSTSRKTTSDSSLIQRFCLQTSSITLSPTGKLHLQNSKHTSTRRGNIRSFATVSESTVKTKDQNKAQSSFDQKQSESSKESVALSDTEDINELMRHPALLDHIKAPRNPIILCHGLYGFDVRGPFWGLEIHYWATVLDILRKKVGADVIVRGVPGTGAIADRAKALHKFLCSEEAGIKGKQVNFIGHSMGGLDARYLISILKPAPEQYTPISLTTLSTPHRGSPFMDWCNANVGVGQDRVEAEIQEAKKKQQQKGSATLTKNAELVEQEDFQQHEISKPPFSLKTPLFVRPSAKEKSTEVNEGKTDQEGSAFGEVIKPIISGVAGSLVQHATSPSSSGPSAVQTVRNGVQETKQEIKTEVKVGESEKKRNGKGSSLIDFSTFNRALSSIGGSFSSYMLSVLDQPAYAMLSTRYMAQVFNPTVPNSPDVSYFSVASRKRNLPIYHPLWLPKLILDAAAESRTAGGERDGSADALGSKSQGNDGLVSVESAKWGKFLGIIDGCDHWDLRGGGAPRWKGKVNPQTGKPLVSDENKEKQKTEMVNEEKHEKEKGSTWNDINRIVRNLISSKADKETSQDAGKQKDAKVKETKPEDEDQKESNSLKNMIASVVPSKSSKRNDDEQGLVDEVANWISDRLPEGNEERRAQAERAADKYVQERSFFERKDQRSGNGEKEKEMEEDKEKKASEPKQDSTNEFNSMNLSVKLRREAAWQEELGHSEKARELRRELAWHRAEWDRALASGKAPASIAERLQRNNQSYPASRELNWDAHAKNRSMYNTNSSSTNPSNSNHQKSAQVTSADELERFWIALCRHLWAHGF